MECGKLVRGLLAMAAVALACTSFGMGATSPKPRQLLELEELQARTLSDFLGEMAVVDSDGNAVSVPATLQTVYYHCRTRTAGRSFDWDGYLHCYVVTWKTQGKSASWCMWSTHLPFGEFRLLQDAKGTNYLAWASGWGVSFAEISAPRDLDTAFQQDFFKPASSHRPASCVYVPVKELVPASERWGRNSFFRDIEVKSVARNADGNWVVRIHGPESRRVYTLISDQKSKLGWRLASPVYWPFCVLALLLAIVWLTWRSRRPHQAKANGEVSLQEDKGNGHNS